MAILYGAPVDTSTAQLLAITVFCIALWITTPIPPAMTGLVCIGLIGVVFSPDLALTGFSSPTVWLVIFGLLLGEATRTSGLAHWGGQQVKALAWPTGTATLPARRAYGRLLAVSSGAAVVFAFLVPSALVRILTMAPILVTLGATFESERARIGIFLAPIMATFHVAPGIYTAGLPNIITTGIAESLGVPTVSWTAWTLQMFPIMGAGRAALAAAVVYILFRPTDSQSVAAPTETDDLLGTEKRMLAFLLIGVLVWSTDVFHGLHPLFGALVVVLLALLPGIGVVSFDDLADVDFSIVFFLGAVFAIAAGLTQTGFTETAARTLLAYVPTDGALWLVLALIFAISMGLTFLLEGLAVTSVLTPIVVSYAQRTGLPIEPILMIESVGVSTYLFPYQSVVLVAILGEDVVDAVTLIRTMAWISVLSIILLVPLQIALFTLLY
ncbi:SLC13 family permease [Natronosalvus halobius]|uniref:SLC13 family permease n=1 Tax=Natronosalvus halobius TaxID=2953746 RepID=UPI0020A14969|nr:SLC13 family permease [Natronosalvus halobius]USZ73641.1 SLC13 family permease [Natronosalvus halobius]